MSLFEKFVTEGNEKAYEPAKEAAVWDARLMAQARASTIQQEREEVFAALEYEPVFIAWWKNGEIAKSLSRSQKSNGVVCLCRSQREKWNFEDKNKKDTNHRTEWCATAKKYRCMRCGRGTKYMK